MTVSVEATFQQYVGTGANTALPTVFVFFDETDIRVTQRIMATGAEAVLTLGVHYEVVGGKSADGLPQTGTVTPKKGSVDFTNAMTWTIERITPKVQQLDYVENDPFPAASHEGGLDRATLYAQEAARTRSDGSATQDRALTIPVTDPTTVNPQIPSSVARANKYLTFDASGNPTVSDPATASGTSVLATGSTHARLLAERFAEVFNVLDYGAVGDGATDDQPAIQAAINAAEVSGGVVYFPAGYTYGLSSALTIEENDVALVGEHPNSTVIQCNYAAGDIIFVNNGASTVRGFHMRGIRIASSVVKSIGAALRLTDVGRSWLDHVIFDGQDGNGNLWHGLWCDQVDMVACTHFEAQAQEDGVRVNGDALGAKPRADLFLSHFKVTGCTIGVHEGGGFGGLTISHADIIENDVNLRISQDIVARSNRGIFVGPTTFIDDANVSGVQIDDPGTVTFTQYFQFQGVWISSSTSHGIHVQQTGEGTGACKLHIEGGTIWNNGGDGIFFDDAPLPFAIIDNVWIRGNTGYGIDASGPDTSGGGIRLGNGNYFEGNTAGEVNWDNLRPRQSYGNAFEVSIDDDDVFSFSPGSSEAGLCWVERVSADRYALWRFRVSASQSRATDISSSSVTVQTGALTGTTGVDTELTVAAHTDGKIYIENRLGVTINVRVHLI